MDIKKLIQGLKTRAKELIHKYGFRAACVVSFILALVVLVSSSLYFDRVAGYGEVTQKKSKNETIDIKFEDRLAACNYTSDYTKWEHCNLFRARVGIGGLGIALSLFHILFCIGFFFVRGECRIFFTLVSAFFGLAGIAAFAWMCLIHTRLELLKKEDEYQDTVMYNYVALGVYVVCSIPITAFVAYLTYPPLSA